MGDHLPRPPAWSPRSSTGHLQRHILETGTQPHGIRTSKTAARGNRLVRRPPLRHPDPVEFDQNSAAFILARQIAAAAPGATVRHSDSHGPDAVTDPRLRDQLAIISGRRLSQFSIAINGLRLAFWGEEAGTVSREIFIEHPTILLTHPGQVTIAHAPDGDAVAAALLSVLNRRASEITLTSGHLIISFETGLTLKVDPDQRYESWQISSDDELLIVCTAETSPSGIHPTAHNSAPFTRQPGPTPATTARADHLTKPVCHIRPAGRQPGQA